MYLLQLNYLATIIITDYSHCVKVVVYSREEICLNSFNIYNNRLLTFLKHTVHPCYVVIQLLYIIVASFNESVSIIGSKLVKLVISWFASAYSSVSKITNFVARPQHCMRCAATFGSRRLFVFLPIMIYTREIAERHNALRVNRAREKITKS